MLQKGSGKLGYESEAFAIYDTMRYIKPVVATVCVGSAFGEAAMLLAAGEPGRRAALPSTSIMIRQPMQRYTQMQASDIDIYRNELRKTNAEVVRVCSVGCDVFVRGVPDVQGNGYWCWCLCWSGLSLTRPDGVE